MLEEPNADSLPVPEHRRSFLKWAVHGLGALFSVIFGFPALMYLINPRHLKPRDPDEKRPAEGIILGELELNKPRQGVIRAMRRDAWALHPNDVIGRVWAVKVKEWDTSRGPDPRMTGADAELLVFTTVCPHLGCSVNLETEGATVKGFACPCHNGLFSLNGTKRQEGTNINPAPRGMDDLAWETDPANRDRLLVKFQSFRQLEAEKIVKS